MHIGPLKSWGRLAFWYWAATGTSQAALLFRYSPGLSPISNRACPSLSLISVQIEVLQGQARQVSAPQRHQCVISRSISC